MASDDSQKWKNNHRIKAVKKGVPDIVTTDPKGHVYHLSPKGQCESSPLLAGNPYKLYCRMPILNLILQLI